MNEYFLLYTEPKKYRLFKEVVFKKLEVEKAPGTVVHLRQKRDKYEATTFHSTTKTIDLKTKTIEDGCTSWINCQECGEDDCCTYKVVDRAGYQVAVVVCDCGEFVRVFKNETCEGVLSTKYLTSNAENSHAFNGKHLWHDRRWLLFRDASSKHLIEFLWSDIDKGEYGKPTIAYAPQTGSEEVADISFRGSYYFILTYNGLVMKKTEDSLVKLAELPKIAEFPLSYHVLLPANSSFIVASFMNASITCRVALFSKTFNEQSAIDIKPVHRSAYACFEELVLLHSSSRFSIVLAIGISRCCSVLRVAASKITALSHNDLEGAVSYDSFGCLVQSRFKKNTFLLGSSDNIFEVKVLFK